MNPPLQALVHRLSAAQADGTTLHAAGLPGLEALQTLDDAEKVQDALLRKLGWAPASWKLGASTYGAQRALGLRRAFLAPLPAARTLAAPARLALQVLRQRGVECELAVSLRAPVAEERGLLQQAPSSESLALAASLALSCHSAIEIPQTRFATLGAAGPLALVADNGAAGWVVVGPAGDMQALHGPCRGVLEIDGRAVAEGRDTAFVMDPLRLLQQFLHQAVQRALLPTGATTVLLGSVTPYHPVHAACRVVARFDGLPAAELTLQD